MLIHILVSVISYNFHNDPLKTLNDIVIFLYLPKFNYHLFSIHNVKVSIFIKILSNCKVLQHILSYVALWQGEKTNKMEICPWMSFLNDFYTILTRNIVLKLLLWSHTCLSWRHHGVMCACIQSTQLEIMFIFFQNSQLDTNN